MSDRCLFYSGLLLLTSPLIFLSADYERYSQITFPHQELLKSLIVAGSIFPSTAVGGLATIYTLLKRVNQNKNKPKEASPLQFICVQHQPVERKDWQRRRRISLAVAVGCLIALRGYSLLLFRIFPPRNGDEARVGVYLVFVIVLFFNMLVCFSVYAKLGKGPEDAHTFFFRSATVEVDAPIETIFAECLRALKRLNA